MQGTHAASAVAAAVGGPSVARELSAKGVEGLDLEIVKVSLNAVRLKLLQEEP